MIDQIWPAPAKLNLFLHILDRREDGYHELQTVFQFLDFSDEIILKPRSDGQIQCYSAAAKLLSTNNLAVRAANLLKQVSNTKQGVDIYLQKFIPIGGGLGGGSSNAATTLVALNKLWELNLSNDELQKLALQLGADVPIFVKGQAAWAEGVGEKLTPIALAESWFIILIPPHPVSTAEIFSATELTRNTRPITIQQFLAGQATTCNNCEPIVRKRYPMVAQALDWLNQFSAARLTGTGGSVFAVMSDEDEALSIAEQVPDPLEVIVAKGLNDSPLLEVSS